MSNPKKGGMIGSRIKKLSIVLVVIAVLVAGIGVATHGAYEPVQNAEETDPSKINVESQSAQQDEPPIIDVNRNDIRFGDTMSNRVRKAYLRVWNLGDQPLKVSNTRIKGDSDRFSIVKGEAPFQLSGGQSRVLVLAFTPDTPGKNKATLKIKSNSDKKPTLEIPLAGTALSGEKKSGPYIHLPQQIIKFNNTEVGNVSSKNMTIRNTGKKPLKVSKIQVESGARNPFSIKGKKSFTLKPRESMTKTVQFKPRDEGKAIAHFVIHSNASNTNERRFRVVGYAPMRPPANSAEGENLSTEESSTTGDEFCHIAGL